MVSQRERSCWTSQMKTNCSCFVVLYVCLFVVDDCYQLIVFFI